MGRPILLGCGGQNPAITRVVAHTTPNDDYITDYGPEMSWEANLSRHVSDVSNGMLTLPSGPLVKADVDVDIWRYHYYE